MKKSRSEKEKNGIKEKSILLRRDIINLCHKLNLNTKQIQHILDKFKLYLKKKPWSTSWKNS